MDYAEMVTSLPVPWAAYQKAALDQSASTVQSAGWYIWFPGMKIPSLVHFV